MKCYLWRDGAAPAQACSSQINFQMGCLATVPSVFDNDSALLYLCDRTAFCSLLTNEGSQMDDSSERSSLYSPLAAIRVISVYCAFGTVGVITDSHKVLMWGRSDHGQCGLLKEYIKEPVQLTIEYCIQMTICANEKCDDCCGNKSHCQMEVQKMSISRYQTLAIDLSNALWAWGTPSEGQPAVLVPYRVSQLLGRHVLTVASGFGHYVVLVEKSVGSTGTLHQLPELKSMRSCRSPRSDEREATKNERYFQFDYSESESECRSEKVPPNGYCPLGIKLTSADGVTTFLDQPGNEAGNSLLGKLVSKFSTCSVSSVDDKFEMLEMPNLSNAANRLSFVSRELIHASISSSESSPFIESSFGCLNAKETKAIAVDSCVSRDEHPPINTEVWTWGLNRFGQLGCTDCDDRPEPKRLSVLDEAAIVSVDAGAFHTVALSCTGEAYVWGSNEDGQIKLSDRLYVAEPTIFKAGSCLKVIELAAGSHFTALLVIGQDLHPQCYVCGCRNLGLGQAVVRVEFPSSVVPLSMYFSNESLVQGCVKAFLDDHSKLPVDCLCKAQYSLMDQNHLLKQLRKILEWVWTEDCIADSYNKLLLKNFSRSLKTYRANVMKSYMLLRALLHSADSFACLKSLFRTFTTDEYQRSLRLLHLDYLALVSSGLFTSIQISGDAEASVRRLSDVYSVAYEKIGRIIEELFFLPFILFSTMHLVICELQKDDQSFKEISNFLSNIGKVFRFYKNKAYDTQKLRTTYKGWNFLECFKEGSSLLFGHFKRGNDRLDFAHVTENSRVLNFLTLLVFSNSIVLTSKTSWRCFQFPLVWLVPTSEGAKHIVKVLLPETELEVEFLDHLALNDFINTFNTAMHLFVGSQYTECFSLCVPPLHRTGFFHFSNGRTYSGRWLLGKPHGSGKMTWTDGRTYNGRFHNGEMEGFGELKTVSNDEWTCVKGQWRNGSLNGLASMEDSSGSLYEGYYEDNKPEGHGALRTVESLFVGEWKKGVKNGYGVLEKSRTKYLGMWEGDLPNGIGVLVTLDGVCCRGSFVKDSFRKGVLYLPDGMIVKGEFASSECLNGKAAVYFPSGECLSGSFYGRIQDSVQITSGCLQKCSAESIVADEVTFPSADMKWSDVFRHAYDLLGQSSIEECDTDKAWESLAAYCGKIQCSSPAEKGALLKENLETDIMYKILDYNAPFNEAYFSMVKAYCKLAFCSTYHPLGRLKNGLVDVFNLSYSGTGVHRCLLLDAIQEAKSIFLRFYKYVRILFPSLPSESDMNNLVSEIDHTTPILSWSLETFSSFICGSILQSIYPNLFTLYVIKNEDSDKVYQSNIRHVNSKSDVLLLDHLGVDREFWPVVFIDTADLDKPSACITARMQYYSKAIDCFQRLSSEFSPIDKFKIIAETFEHVNRCVSENCENVVACPWTADNLVPITTYVLIRAQIQRLGAELNFIRDFAPSLDDAGEIQCYSFFLVITLILRGSYKSVPPLVLSVVSRERNFSSSASLKMEESDRLVEVQFKNEEGNKLGDSVYVVPYSISAKELEKLCNHLLESEEILPCSFFVNDLEISDTLGTTIASGKVNVEKVVDIVYRLNAVYRVQAVTRCTSSLPGHGEAVISTLFSPDGKRLASGSGDTTVRFWDLSTEMPQFTCKGHNNWVLCLSWSADGQKLASGCKSGCIIVWNPDSGERIGKVLSSHRSWVNSITWKPLHLDPHSRFLASSSKDHDIRIWDVVLGQSVRVLSGHTASVTCVRWGGEGLIYSASQDRTIKVWRADDGVLCRTLSGHAHWVNSIALHTDYALRCGAFDPKDAHSRKAPTLNTNPENLRTLAQEIYDKVKGSGPERMVSGSDDFTMFLWLPASQKKPVTRMTGHQQLVNQVLFSPDGFLVASASFDHSIKIWCGRTGKFLRTLRGHVQAVYQISWSSDSRLLVSGSADSTLKLWDAKDGKLLIDLPGHADEVYAVDWSPNGERVVSGGKDKVLKL
ncbi:hypothetical protein M513_03138 [Trichuris suis]|uniref:VPS9 domain-containing protein n=1 Tax=Trichuris suis TaxID=68888 RepID=A0A085MFL8_9BILA|nr:hypothetical protein M513_03138 [Trichuris suis]